MGEPRAAEGVEAVHALLLAHQRGILLRSLVSCTRKLPAELADCALAARTLSSRQHERTQAPGELLLQDLFVRELVRGAGREPDFKAEARLWQATARHRALAARVTEGVLRRVGEGGVPCLVRRFSGAEDPCVTGVRLVFGRGACAMRMLCVIRGTEITAEGVEGTRGALSVDQQGLDAFVVSALNSLAEASHGAGKEGSSAAAGP